MTEKYAYNYSVKMPKGSTCLRILFLKLVFFWIMRKQHYFYNFFQNIYHKLTAYALQIEALYINMQMSIECKI